MKDFFIFLKKVFSEWFVYLSVIPTIIDTLFFYLSKTPNITLGTNISIAFFVLFFLIASYKTWREERVAKESLDKQINEIKNRKPKMELTFQDNKTTFNLNNAIIKRKINSSIMNLSLTEQLKMKNFRGYLLNPLFSKPKELEEVYKEFIPIIFELHNLGDVKATNVRVKVKFPKDVLISEGLPKSGWYFTPSLNLSRRGYGEIKVKENEIKLWDNESLHPDITCFDPLYFSARKKGKFKIEYIIFSEELDCKGIKGELFINASPKDELLIYPGNETLRQDQEKYNTYLAEALKYG